MRDVLQGEVISLMKVLNKRKDSLIQQKERFIISIDGRCASGKTTFAKKLCQEWDAAVIHMDDFFLRPEQRTESRMNEAGGNVDYERFFEEVLQPLKNGERPMYRPYHCCSGKMGDFIELPQKSIYIVEGSYSAHPKLMFHYDLLVFLTTNFKTQIERLQERNPDTLTDFTEKWIPLEERYFKTYLIEENSDLVYRT